MNTLVAIELMKQGQKIRCDWWEKDDYLFYEDGVICNSVEGLIDDDEFRFNLAYIESNDWVIYEDSDDEVEDEVIEISDFMASVNRRLRSIEEKLNAHK